MSRLGLSTLPLAVAVLLLAATDVRAQRYQPFGPLDFEHDAQPFAPAEIDSYGGEPIVNTGFFMTYDRMNLNVTRAQTSVAPFEGDWTWGNRLDLGYMTDDRHGWLVEIIHVDGPNVHQNPLGVPPGPVENSVHFTSVEVMKQWRWKPLHHGSIVEWFAGARYSFLQHQDSFPFVVAGQVFNGVVAENHIYGPQIGLRWYKKKGRITVSSEGRYYFGFNDQFFGSGANAAGNIVTRSEQRWVHAGSVRLEATCDFSKSIALAVGWDLTYLGNGVARGVPPFNDQDVLMTGVTFGFKVNR